MNKNQTPQPRWRTLYIIGAVGIALMFVVPLMNLSEAMERAAFSIIAGILCGGMGLWISANHHALEAGESSFEDVERHRHAYNTLKRGDALIREANIDTSMNDGEKEVA
jgi:hypothetical protein